MICRRSWCVALCVFGTLAYFVCLQFNVILPPWPLEPGGYSNLTIVGANSYTLSRIRLDLKTKNNS